MLTTILSNGKKILPYSIERYKKGEKSKIKMVCDIVAELPSPKGKAYGICDSWFTNKDVINAHFQSGYHLIGALKIIELFIQKVLVFRLKISLNILKRMMFASLQ